MTERARLAIVSPHDEADALSPLTEDEAWQIIGTVEAAERS